MYLAFIRFLLISSQLQLENSHYLLQTLHLQIYFLSCIFWAWIIINNILLSFLTFQAHTKLFRNTSLICSELISYSCSILLISFRSGKKYLNSYLWLFIFMSEFRVFTILISKFLSLTQIFCLSFYAIKILPLKSYCFFGLIFGLVSTCSCSILLGFCLFNKCKISMISILIQVSIFFQYEPFISY